MGINTLGDKIERPPVTLPKFALADIDREAVAREAPSPSNCMRMSTPSKRGGQHSAKAEAAADASLEQRAPLASCYSAEQN